MRNYLVKPKRKTQPLSIRIASFVVSYVVYGVVIWWFTKEKD